MSMRSIITKIERHDKCSSCNHSDLDSNAIDGYHTYCFKKKEWIFDLDDIEENGCPDYCLNLPIISNEVPQLKVNKYRPDMFIRCPDGNLHEWGNKLYPLPYPRQGTCQICVKCGQSKGHDSSD